MLTLTNLLRLHAAPEIFIKNVLGDFLDKNQLRIARAVAKFDRVAVASCHSIGKTFTSARLALWFLTCYPNSLVLTTAPTERQVSFLLWGEIRKAFESSKWPLKGKMRAGNLLEIKEKEWYAIGFSPQAPAKTKEMMDSTEQQKVIIQGWHGDYIFVILDEAVGIDADIWTQIEGILTSGKVVKILAIGNPTTKNCIFHTLFDSPVWHSLYVTCFDTPNMIANGLTDMAALEKEGDRLAEMNENERLLEIKKYKRPVPHILLAGWVVERFLQWGKDDPRFQGKAIGLFPDADEMTLISERVVKEAWSRKHFAKEDGVRYIGVDVARKGTNLTVFTELQDGEDGHLPVQTKLKRLKGRDLMSVTGELVAFCKFDWDEVNGPRIYCCIDATGIGSGVYDRVREMQRFGKLTKRIKFIEVHNGAGVQTVFRNPKNPTEKELNEQKTYLNVGALAYNDLAEALKDGLRIKEEKCYLKQLPGRRFDYKSTGKQFMESKKDFAKRMQMDSPDEGDSLVLANFARRWGRFGDFMKKLVG